jgi:hypothetical protein
LKDIPNRPSPSPGRSTWQVRPVNGTCCRKALRARTGTRKPLRLVHTAMQSRDFERHITSAEAMAYRSMTLLMTRCLARPRPARA